MPKESVIKHYSSSTTGSVPSAVDLVEGELAINTADEKVFFKNLGGSVVDLASSKAISGAYAAKALPNTFTALQTFSGGINVSAGATFSGSVESDTGYRIGAGAINAQTVGYSLVAGDNGKVITINSASAITLTAGTAVGTTGFSCSVIQLGAGQITITGSGVTMNSYSGLKIQGQHGAASIVCYATNTFNVAGNLTT